MRLFTTTAVLCLLAAGGVQAAEPPVAPADRALHERLLTLDTHLDTPANFGLPGWDIMDRHLIELDSQVDHPRMVEGGLDGGFFVIYTAQGELTPQAHAEARDKALLRAVEIREMVARHPDRFELAYTAADAARITAAGKRFVYQSLENSYPLGEDLTLLATFQKLGVRMAGPVHFKANALADSATGPAVWNGLSPLGRQWVAEMNRLGLIIDASHASDAAFDQMLTLSKTPIILSHSGPKAVFDHPRNLDDERLRRLAAAGGVVQINSIYLSPTPTDPAFKALKASIEARQPKIAAMTPTERDAYVADVRRFNALGQADFETFMKSLLHTLKVAGVDHVGIGCDWDGGGGVAGMADITALPKITARLRAAGYSETDIGKIWSGNTLRLLAAAEAYAKSVAPPAS